MARTKRARKPKTVQVMAVKAGKKSRRGARKGRRRAGKKQFVISRAPAATSASLKPYKSTDHTICIGQDDLGTIQIPDTGIVDGAILFSADICPQLTTASRLNALGKAYDKYRFRRFSVVVSGMAPSGVGGGYIAGASPDPTVRLNNNPKNVVLGWNGCQTGSWWKAETVTLDCSGATMLSTSQNPLAQQEQDLSIIQGRFVLLSNGVPNGFTGSLSVQLLARWEVEFQGAMNRESNDITPGSFVVPNLAYAGAAYICPPNGTSGNASYMGSTLQYNAAANGVIATIVSNMVPNNKAVYVMDPPLWFPGVYSGAASGNIQYAWWDGSTAGFKASNSLQTAMTNGNTSPGANAYFAWTLDHTEGEEPNNLSFTAISTVVGVGVKSGIKLHPAVANATFNPSTLAIKSEFALMMESFTDCLSALGKRCNADRASPREIARVGYEDIENDDSSDDEFPGEYRGETVPRTVGSIAVNAALPPSEQYELMVQQANLSLQHYRNAVSAADEYAEKHLPNQLCPAC